MTAEEIESEEQKEHTNLLPLFLQSLKMSENIYFVKRTFTPIVGKKE